MRSWTATGQSRLLLWARVREFAVSPSMIESAMTRRRAGDWAGACAAARVDVDLDLRAAAHRYGRDLTARLRDDLRHLAPDLLRWHMPRIAPDGLLRPGLTVPLARYRNDDGDAVHLVARTPPAWADAGQRISLTLWDGSDNRPERHPHPHPDRRYRFDLHRHLWDARRAAELRERAGVGIADPPDPVPPGIGCAVDRWAAEAAILLRADGLPDDVVTVRIGTRRLALAFEPAGLRITTQPGAATGPILPDAATWVPPDVELLAAGRIGPDRLHPLVAEALVPGYVRPERPPTTAGAPRTVACRGAEHRIGLVDGSLVPLDHDPVQIRREELLAALGGPPLPCLRAIDDAHRQPESLVDVRALLDHGYTADALAVVEGLLGPDVLPRSGTLRDELQAAEQRRIDHGLFRAGIAVEVPVSGRRRPERRGLRMRARHGIAR
jgi:hypothetical protein